jgi:hypothetical protein
VVLEANIVAHVVFRLPAVAERWVGDNSVELRHLRRIVLAEKIPVIEQRVAAVNFELPRGRGLAIQFRSELGFGL